MHNKMIIILSPWRVHISLVLTAITGMLISNILPVSFQGHWYTIVMILVIFLLYILGFNFLLNHAYSKNPFFTKNQQLKWQLVLLLIILVLMLLGLAVVLIMYK